MSVGRQQGGAYQPDLFDGSGQAVPRPGEIGVGETGAGSTGASQARTASARERALTTSLMERVCVSANLNHAWKRVKANKGAPGIDDMAVGDFLPWLADNRDGFLAALLSGDYQPQPVLGVEIPKPGGGMRRLGIPTVRDRLVQQAILQVLQPLLDPMFSDHSHGFRPGRSAHGALRQAGAYVGAGYDTVVDLDLSRFFDRVNHDMVMARLARHIGDKRLLKIVRRFLEAGMMIDGVCRRRLEGTPQGGPLSPLLANLLLDDLDKMLEARGHRFVRYADDCNIHVRSMAAGERVMASVTEFLEGRLRLRVNREKSAVAPAWERTFLGHRLLPDGTLGVSPKSLKRVKDRLRRITRRNRGIPFEVMIGQVNAFTGGWVTYYRHARCARHLDRLDGWLRRKLRCVRLKQRKRPKAIADFLMAQGVPERRAWIIACSGKGWWRMALSWQAAEAMPNSWFDQQGLISLANRHRSLNLHGNRRGTEYVCPVV